MRKILHLLLLTLILASFQAQALSITINGVEYTHIVGPTGYEVSVSSYTGTDETLVIPETIEYNGETYTVVHLANLLYNNKVVKHLTLPSTITSSSYYSSSSSITPFESCALEEIDMSHITLKEIRSFDYYFHGCENLKSIKMPQTSVPVGEYMCQGCTALESITFSPKTTSIKASAFSGCSNLSETNLAELTNLTTIFDAAFNKTNLSELILPESLTSMGKNVFSNNTALTAIKFNSKLKSLPENAFSGCTLLKEIVIPENITSIGASVFYNCTALQSVSLSSTITTIDKYAFENCSALESINIPESLTAIGIGAFKGCSMLPKLILPSSLTSLGSSAFSSCKALTSIDLSNTKVTVLNGYTFSGCSSLETVNLPTTLTAIGQYEFDGCSALQHIDMSQTKVASIGNYAFRSCKLLTTVDFSNTLTTIGQYIFQNSGIPSVTLPASLTTVGTYAFCGTPALEYVDMSQCNVTTLPEYVFNECSALETVLLPSVLTTIQKYAFYKAGIKNLTLPASLKTLGTFVCNSCPSLESLDMSETQVTEIPDNAFTSCPSLSRIEFPQVLNKIGSNAFWGSAITSLELPASVTTVSLSAFKNCLELTTADLSNTAMTVIGGSLFEGCAKLSDVKFPKNVATIGSTSFKGTALPSITFPETVTSVGTYAFQSCTALKSADMSKSKFTSVPNYLFSGCTALTEVYFPETVTTYGTSVFETCTALQTVDLSRTKLTTLPTGAFSSKSALTTVKLPETLTVLGSNCFLNSGITAIVSGDNK
ncbi:MAG: leucine-rich repeat domain-containing protein, partial [Muribaculaceae bacterium]|nr:leucine-rich repeat domain-containing protein [Muribaculaceae bacterium]